MKRTSGWRNQPNDQHLAGENPESALCLMASQGGPHGCKVLIVAGLRAYGVWPERGRPEVTGHRNPINEKPRRIRAGSVQQVQQMKNDDITISEFGEAADDVMTEMTAAGRYGMTPAQAEIVARMTRLLDKAAKIINGVIEGGESGKLISKAANHALSMRIYGATLRGIAGAELLEDLCDAAIGRHLQAVAAAALAAKTKTDIENSMTVEEAMTMLDCRSYAAFSDILDCSLTTVKNWRSRGRVPADWAEKVRGMKVRAAA